MNATERLCVATYGESLAWVVETGMEACVYDATSTRPGLIPVPNDGREATQYLRHIIACYGNFRDYDIFLQGNPTPHNPSIIHVLGLRPWLGLRVHPLGRRTLPFNFTTQHPHPRGAEVFAAEIGIPLDHQTRWTMGAMFAASRQALMDRPLAWWQRLLAKVIIEREASPWEMERLWLEILR